MVIRTRKFQGPPQTTLYKPPIVRLEFLAPICLETALLLTSGAALGLPDFLDTLLCKLKHLNAGRPQHVNPFIE
jgi:hypothetical protein